MELTHLDLDLELSRIVEEALTEDVGSGDVSLTVGDVYGTEPGIWMEFEGNGSLDLVANGDITGLTGSGVYIDGGAAGDDYDIQVGNVTGGVSGIEIENQGTGATTTVSTAPVAMT